MAETVGRALELDGNLTDIGRIEFSPAGKDIVDHLLTDEERQEGLDYLRRVSLTLDSSLSPADRARGAWSSYLRILLGSNEFLFVD